MATTDPPGEPAPKTDPTQKSEHLKSHLESLTKSWITALNDRDFPALNQFFSSYFDHERFTARINDNVSVSSYKDFLNFLQAQLAGAPDVQVQFHETNTVIDEEQGVANAYINAEAPGQPGGLTLSAVMILEWKRTEDGRWLCTNYSLIKGLEGG